MTPFDLLLEPWRVYLLLLVIFVSIFAARRTHPVVTILVLTRYSWAMMVVQFAIGLIALVGFPLIGPSLFKNLFVLSEPLQIGAITCVSLVLATTALVTFRTTKLSAVNRFRDYDVALHDDAGAKTQAGWKRRLYQTLQSGPEQRDDWHKRWLLLIVIAFPLVVAAASDTYSDFAQVNRNTPAVLGGLVGGFIAGVACWGLLVAAATIFQQIFLQATVTDKGLFPFDRWQLVPRGLRLRWFDWLMRALARRVACFGPGYAVEDGLGNWRLQPGHAQLAFFAIVLSILYGLMLFKGLPEHGPIFSALFGLLTMLLIVTVLTTGISFFLDYFRLPLIPSLVVYGMLMWTVASTDSYYSMGPPPGAVAQPAPRQDANLPLPVSIKPVNGKRTLVVVTAAGGGILAAGWTAQVLTGLHEIYGDKFTGSIGLVSAVSGGGVGALFFLDRWSDTQRGLEKAPDVLNSIRENATRSSLEATAEGMAGWDTVKAFIPVVKARDRGFKIEESWRLQLQRKAATLADWARQAQANRFPIVVFNATAVENGKRFMISNCLLPGGRGFLKRPADGSQAIEYAKLYESMNLSVATAARLSATFPYVSPICRPLGDVAEPYHVADGGYVDNEGVATALDWLDHLIAIRNRPAEAAPFDRILVIRIVPIADDSKPEFHSHLGWVYATFGPLTAMINVRSTSQHERNEFALQLFRKASESIKIPFETAEFQLTGLKDPPLSWKLSQTEVAAIKGAWAKLVADADNPNVSGNPLNIVKDWFE
jgi:hypothetical protein